MMNFEVDNVSMNVSCKRNIVVNEDIQLVVQNTVVLYESKNNTFLYDVEEIDLVHIWVKGKKFEYKDFFNVKKSITLIYDICIDNIIKDNEYSDKKAGDMGKLIAKKYENVLKIM